MNSDTKTTILGVLVAGIMAASINWFKLLAGDAGEIGKLAAALATAAWAITPTGVV